MHPFDCIYYTIKIWALTKYYTFKYNAHALDLYHVDNELTQYVQDMDNYGYEVRSLTHYTRLKQRQSQIHDQLKIWRSKLAAL